MVILIVALAWLACLVLFVALRLRATKPAEPPRPATELTPSSAPAPRLGTGARAARAGR